MKQFLIVGLGGGIGSMVRYGVARWMLVAGAQPFFPWATFAVNVSGCLVIGVLAGLADRFHLFSENATLLLFTGLLGGFTTFSSFGLEAMFLMRRGEWGWAALYVAGSLLFGLLAVWLGMKAVEAWPG
ncbi:MAG TPA: fluoride efflux transporter CrcB [Chthoniobacteraceae bacterium]|nr:fluoride efflux transporter CrcB [Chthoniobacteraceae bacterium]